MRYRFNPFERAVGLFLITSVVGSISIGAVLAVKKNWFEEKITFHTYVPSADNIREGSSVFMSGLKVGKIEKIELDASRQIQVKFSVLKKYHIQMTKGSIVKFTRPFVIGDKMLTLVQGPANEAILNPGATLPVAEQFDVMEMLSGKGLEATMAKVDSILTHLEATLQKTSVIANAFGEEKKLKETLENIHSSVSILRKNLPQTSQQVQEIIANINELTGQLKTSTPEGSKKLIELLGESVVTLKSIQKNYFLRDHVEVVREEMAKENKVEQNRLPASETSRD